MDGAQPRMCQDIQGKTTPHTDPEMKTWPPHTHISTLPTHMQTPHHTHTQPPHHTPHHTDKHTTPPPPHTPTHTHTETQTHTHTHTHTQQCMLSTLSDDV